MKFFDVGPEPIQVTGYFGKGKRQRPPSPGGVRDVSKVKDFYDETRLRARPWAYSIFCVAVPGAVLAWALLTIDHDLPESRADGVPEAFIEGVCASPDFLRALANVGTASVLHFTVTQVVLLTACVLAFAFAAWTIRNVLAIHCQDVLSVEAARSVAVVTPLIVGGSLFVATKTCFGKPVWALFGNGAAFAQWHADAATLPCLKDALSLADTLDAHAFWGALAVTLSGVALALAAATIAFRFETDDIDGYWADSYVLRHKLKALLTLFLLASVVLVVTNIALSAYTDFAANAFSEIEASGIACFRIETADAQSHQVKLLCPKAEAGASVTKDGGANEKNAKNEKRDLAGTQGASASPKPHDAVAELFAQVKSLRKTLLNLAGGLASLTLVAMFLPAFAGLTSDIEIAGKTHADAAGKAATAAKTQDPKQVKTGGLVRNVLHAIGFVATAESSSPDATAATTNFNVAGWKDVKTWKEDHGLSLQFSDLATTLAAAAAPLLSNGVFDLSKSLFGGS